jgi:transcriptional regulator with XRE-family HTH domain
MQDENELRLDLRLKAEREARRWSLADLAERSGVSKAMISKLERGECSPTAVLLGRLSGAFGLTLSQLLARTENAQGLFVAARDQASWRDGETGFVRRALTPQGGTATPLELVWGELPPGISIAYPAAAVSFIQDQQIVVVEGRLRFTQNGAAHILDPGDCVRLGSPAPCEFFNPGEGVCRYIVAILRQ